MRGVVRRSVEVGSSVARRQDSIDHGRIIGWCERAAHILRDGRAFVLDYRQHRWERQHRRPLREVFDQSWRDDTLLAPDRFPDAMRWTRECGSLPLRDVR